MKYVIKILIIISLLFTLSSCNSYIDVKGKSDSIVDTLFLAKSDPVNVQVTDVLNLNVGNKVDLFSMRSNGSSFSNIPVKWSLINEIGDLTVTSGGTKGIFVALKAGKGFIQIEQDGIEKKITINVSSENSSSWGFVNSSDYTFNSNFIEFNSMGVTLKKIKEDFSESDFSLGNHLGTNSLNSKVEMISNSNETHVSNILPSRSASLRSYWRFDGDLQDESGFSHGVTSAAPIFVQGKIGQGVSFDGSKYVELNSSASRLLNYTISFWYYPGQSGHVLHRGRADGGCHYNPVLIYDDSIGELTFRSSGCSYSGQIGKARLLKDRWNHIVVTRTNSPSTRQVMYINGVEVISGSKGTNNFSGYKFVLGMTYNSSSFPSPTIRGVIDELALWETAISDSEVLKLFNGQSLLFAEETALSHLWTPHWNEIEGYWKFDGNLEDSSKKNNFASRTGGVSYTDQSKVGGQAIEFDGVDGRVTPKSLDLSTWNQFSACAWYNTTANLTNYNRILSISHSGFDDIRIYFENNILKFGVDDGTAYTVSDTEGGNDGFWNHVCGVFDGTHISLYRNSKLIDKSVASFDFSTANGDIVFGKKVGGNNYFEGIIDDAVVFKTGLSNDDISIIYNRQKQKYAATYESPVFDLLSSQVLNSITTKTDIPFMKELVNRKESSLDYSSLNGDLSDGLIGHWTFNEASFGTAADIGSGNTDFNDFSGNLNNLSFSGPSSDIKFLKKSFLNHGVKMRNGSLDGPFENIVKDSQSLTFSWWIKTTNTTQRMYLFQGNSSVDSTLVDISLNHKTTGALLANNGRVFFRPSSGTHISKNFDASKLLDGSWHHLAVTIDIGQGLTNIYIDGKLSESSDNGLASRVYSSFNDYSRLASSYVGFLDESAIWNRVLSSSEIQDLFQRGANRIKYQIRSCIDPTCSTEPNWKGIGGDGTSYFSELYNRSKIVISDMFSSCDSSDDNLCSANEFNFTGSTQDDQYSIQFVDSLINNYNVVNARYLQYRVLMEAQENSACSGEACFPSLSSIKFNTDNSYYNNSPSVTSLKPIKISSNILNVKEFVTGNCHVSYQFSKDGTNFYYYNLSDWVSAGDMVSQSNTLSEINSRLNDFIITGSLYVRAYLKSNGYGPCELSKLLIVEGI